VYACMESCVCSLAMRTNIVIDDRLMKRAMKLTGLRTKRATVEAALRELIRRHDQRRILELEGKIRWVGDLDQMRAGRDFDADLGND